MDRRRRLLWVAALLAVTAVAMMWHNARHHADPADPSSAAVASSPNAAITPSSTPSSTPTPTASQAPSSTPTATPRQPATHLQGDALDQAWLRAYLTRPKGTKDTGWQQAIAALSDPGLVTRLTADTSNPVGLTWPVWKVTAMKKVTLPGTPASAPTRQVTNWLVSMAGPGKKDTSQRLYTLTSYQGDQGWIIAQAQQGYTSNG